LVGGLIAVTAVLVVTLLAHHISAGQDEAVDLIGAVSGPEGIAGHLREMFWTSTVTPTASATPTDTAQPTATPLPATQAPTATTAPTYSLTPSDTPLPTVTSTPTLTPTPTATPHPLPTPDGALRTLDVPILMYHYISEPPAGSDAIRTDLSVTPERFDEQLAYLKSAGYTTISLNDLVRALTVGAPLPERPIVLTFDDGYRDAYEHAYPLLTKYGYAGTFFLITSYIDQGHPEYLTWPQVSEMAAAGMSMEAHGYTHDAMEGRGRDYLIWQMLGSKEAIEERTGEIVRCFCYPSGHYDEEAMQVLHELGYWAATTTLFGHEHSSESLFDLERVRVHGDYTLPRFSDLLEALE